MAVLAAAPAGLLHLSAPAPQDKAIMAVHQTPAAAVQPAAAADATLLALMRQRMQVAMAAMAVQALFQEAAFVMLAAAAAMDLAVVRPEHQVAVAVLAVSMAQEPQELMDSGVGLVHQDRPALPSVQPAGTVLLLSATDSGNQ